MVELGKERISEEDITSLPVHHCYVRATVGVERLPAFSMMVRKPEPGDPLMASRIREASKAYTTPVKEIDSVDIDSQALVQKYRDGLRALRNREAELEQETAVTEQPARRKTRSKHGTTEEDDAPVLTASETSNEGAEE